MDEITENKAWALAENNDCPVIHKEASDPMEAAVCLKLFPTGYVVGASDKSHALRLWFTPTLSAAEAHYYRLAARMRETGSPFA